MQFYEFLLIQIGLCKMFAWIPEILTYSFDSPQVHSMKKHHWHGVCTWMCVQFFGHTGLCKCFWCCGEWYYRYDLVLWMQLLPQGMYPYGHCSKSNFITHIFMNKAIFHSSHTRRKFPICTFSNWSTINVIYLLNCRWKLENALANTLIMSE